jgi:HEAT repeat protein
VTYEAKIATILRLEDHRVLRDTWTPPAAAPLQPVDHVVPPTDLVVLLADREGRVRRRAALAIGRVGLRDGVAPLVTGLADAEPEVRQMAAFALGLLGDRQASGPLRTALGDPAPLVRGRAAEALGALGDLESATAISAMVAAEVRAGAVSHLDPDEFEYLGSPSAEPFRLGLNALVRLKAFAPLSAAVLDGTGQPTVRWWPVAWALQRLEDKRTLPVLMAFARGPGNLCRSLAARGLGALRDPAAVDVLLPMVQTWAGDPTLAIVAVQALAQIGDNRAAAVLLKVLRERDLDVGLKVEVVAALGAVSAQEASDVLLDSLSDPYPPVRIAALRSLRALDGQNFLAVLSGLDADRDWSVRAANASIMGSFEADTSLPRLQQALKDPDPRVIPAVLAALVRVRAPGIAVVLASHLANADPVIRAAAAAGLGELKPTAAPAASPKPRRELADPLHVGEEAAVDAIAAERSGAALPLR